MTLLLGSICQRWGVLGGDEVCQVEVSSGGFAFGLHLSTTRCVRRLRRPIVRLEP